MVPALIAMAEGNDKHARQGACEALGCIKDAAALPVLVPAVTGMSMTQLPSVAPDLAGILAPASAMPCPLRVAVTVPVVATAPLPSIQL